MKTYRIYFGILMSLLLGMLLMLSSCDDGGDDDGANPNPTADFVTLREVTLSGAQEVPANNSQATGTFRGRYDKNTKRLSYNITFQGMTATAMHFHKGAAGQPGPVVIPINPGSGSDPYSNNNPFSSPISGTTPALTADQEADLLAGNWFLNIHSAQFPDGEIRAQVVQ